MIYVSRYSNLYCFKLGFYYLKKNYTIEISYHYPKNWVSKSKNKTKKKPLKLTEDNSQW